MLHIITALPCEAKPLIQHYRLNGRQAENGFRIYENGQIRLIIAGIGKCAAAAASAYLQGNEPKTRHAWLNLGIAGHGSLNVGEVLLAHKVIDAATGNHWYPAMPFKIPCATAELISVDQPETEYQGDCAYDMEASGFYATACRFNSSELVQVLKIISDNQTNPADQISGKQVEEIISTRLDIIEAVVQQLMKMSQQVAQQLPPTDLLQEFQQHWHFTVSQQHQLLRLLQRWQARSIEPLNVYHYRLEKNSKTVLQLLERRIDRLPFRFEKS